MHKFLHDLLFTGRISLHALSAGNDAEASRVLLEAYNTCTLSIAGPRLPFDEATALAAGRLLMHAAWYFLNPGTLIEASEKTLHMPSAPKKLEQHLSADLTLRFLPTLQRRAEAMSKNDILPQRLQETLRQWPLSGVLADIAEPPSSPVDFGNHAGLNFLYAERLVQHERPGWFPVGQGMQYVELVWRQLGKDVSLLPALQATAQELQKQDP